MSEIFSNIPQIKYEGPKSTNPFAFRHYNPEEVVAGKTMKEQLKFAMSYWHTMGGDGTDMFGVGTADKSFGGKDPMEVYKNKVAAGFELMNKLGIEYFCFHDKDIAPEGETLKEFQDNLDVIVPLIKREHRIHRTVLLVALIRIGCKIRQSAPVSKVNILIVCLPKTRLCLPEFLLDRRVGNQTVSLSCDCRIRRKTLLHSRIMRFPAMVNTLRIVHNTACSLSHNLL